MDSLRQVLRFSRWTNTHGLCGRQDTGVFGLLKKAEWGPRDTERAKGFVRSLEGMFPYLQAIGRAVGKSPFDQEVVDAYMVGWDGWGSHGELIRERLQEGLRGVALPKKRKLVDELPRLPYTHSFHVLYFGAVAIDIPKVLSFADRCKVSVGTVEGGVAAYNKLMPGTEQGGGRVELSGPSVPAGDGDRVFLHHGTAFRRATPALEAAYRDNLREVLEWLGAKEF